jgi:hypothetical protein
MQADGQTIKGYTPLIREILAREGYLGLDPEGVEEWMRVEHPTLDHLDRARFTDEVRIAAECQIRMPWPKEETR